MKTWFNPFIKSECLRTRARLTSYLDCELSDKEQQELKLHLKSCQSCCEEYNSLRQTISLLQHMPEIRSEHTFRIDEKNVTKKTCDRKLLILSRTAAVVAIILVLVCIGDLGHLFTPTGDSPLGGQFWLVRGVELGLLVALIVLISCILVELHRQRKR
ncbi:MAG: zf-HC2 domain-containing protein [Dehalococcoidales bacterium]|nr:zf-HC2 domain-containing protein [Dehalococcoidales bacterium]